MTNDKSGVHIGTVSGGIIGSKIAGGDIITYTSDNAEKTNSEISKLIKLVQDSKNLSDENKEDATQALNSIADQVKENKANKLTLKGTLTAVQDVVSKAADIAGPGLAIVSTVFKLLGL